jgi:protein O-mannosyl-transferase
MRPPLVLGGALALLTVLAFLPSLGNGYVILDDPLYVTANREVRQGITLEGAAWALTANVANNWHPLTVLSHMLDVEVFGLPPVGHHLTSLLLHLAGVLLLFEALRRMTGAAYRSALVAALFAVHPTRVESVAWISERKDVLSGLFWMLALLAYLGWVRRPSAGRYLLVTLALALGLAAKPMVVTLPCVLLLLDFWPLGRRGLRGLIVEKIPLFALSAASSVVTLHYQRTSMAPLDVLPWDLRLANAAVSYVSYLGKAFLPRNLAVFYPFPMEIPAWKTAGAVLLLALVTALAVWRARKSPWLLVGWLWFLGTLVPVIGLVQVGRQAMADRYTYLPFVGLFLAVVWGTAEWAERRGALRPVLGALAVLAILGLAGMTRAQTRHWRDGVTLFRHALAVTGNNPLARQGLARALAAAQKAGVHGHAVRKAQPRDEKDGGRLRPPAPDL